MTGRLWTAADFALDATVLAQALLGQTLVRRTPDGQRLAGKIVETEAYLGVEDLAAHSSGGRRTPRNEVMYGPAGVAYVYFTYGMHHCFNVVCGEIDHPVAVLVRALEPVEGVEVMRAYRNGSGERARPLRDRDLASGPGKLCQALRITRAHNGISLSGSTELSIEAGQAPGAASISVGPRIGVAYAGEWARKPLRWWVTGNPHVSVEKRGRGRRV